MKIYEKPMASLEIMDIEDVITSSTVELNAAEKALLAGAAGTDNIIVFEW